MSECRGGRTQGRGSTRRPDRLRRIGRHLPQPVTRQLTRFLAVVTLTGGLLFSGAPLQAQDAPPPAGPMPELRLPAAGQATLSNGATVLTVPGSEVPAVSVTLVIPAGSATDPAGLEGRAAMAARLLAAGTGNRTAADVRAALDTLGISLTATTGPDFVRIDLRALPATLASGLELMADLVTDPAFPTDALESARRDALPQLTARGARPEVLAEEFFLAEVYGDHPYGRRPSAASVEALSRDDLVAWHRELVEPGRAVFVVAGDVDEGGVTGALETAFASWSSASPRLRPSRTVANRAGTEVVVVDRPGLARAEVRMGHLLPSGADPDWPVLGLAARVLGGGSGSWLDRRLRVELGHSPDPFAMTGRRMDRGYVQVGFSAGNRVVGEALGEALAELQRLRDQLVPEEELTRVRDRILGEEILALETPAQVGEHLARNWILGLPADATVRSRERLGGVVPESLRRVARSHLKPREMVIVVVGDAASLREQLEPFGPVRVVNLRGGVTETLQPADMQASVELSGEGLEPLTARYAVLFQGQEVGTSTRTLDIVDDTLVRFGTRANLGPQEVEQSVTARLDDLAFVSSEVRIRSMGQELSGSLERRGDRIQGVLRSPVGDTDVDVAAGDDVLVSDMLELAIWVADLEVGKSISVPVLNIQSGRVEAVRLVVTARRDDLESDQGVPLGDLFVIRVDASDPQMIFARVRAPHIVVLLQPESQPVDVILRSVTTGVNGFEGGAGEDPGAPGVEVPGGG